MGHKRIRILLVVAVGLLATAVPLGPARSASGTPCRFEVDLIATPGLTTSPSSGTITSQGEKGRIDCDGPVNGQRPTGSGTMGADGRYGVQKAYTCHEDGNGEGVLSMTIPRAGGSEHVTNNFTYTVGALQDNRVFSGTFRSDRFNGTFEARPTEGDCVSSPMTRFRITGQGTLT
ncbi:MAG: hypothetical protein LC792_20520 [Actinobacteria bacterium]|nr:hypothetical protein [Actinomycetota bacterium]